MRWRTPVIILLAVALVGAAYIYLPYLGWNNSEADARRRVTEYLTALVLDTGDRGWDLLEGSGRAQYGSEEAYRSAMAEADWTDFAWELSDSSRCDDGICTFILRLPNGVDSAPEVAWSDGPGDLGVLVSTKESAGGARGTGVAALDVLQRGWFGGIGVVVFGVGSPG
jgi:hypothetical protein